MINATMTTTSQFKDLNEFLAKHSAKNNENNKPGESASFTHTRIGDKNLNIYAGSYIIPQEDKETFYKLYYESVFEKKRKEYLTEKQIKNGPLAVDFDFRYSFDVKSRQHSREHIQDMVCEYSDLLKEYLVVKPDTPFDIFVFEKPNVNRLADGSLTKDGIHMIIGLQVETPLQLIIREKMISKLAEIWELPLINTWESVLDEGISKGTTNWQLFGSRKPDNEAYELTQHYIMTFDIADKQFIMDEADVSEFNLKRDFEKLSVQYEKNPKFEINPKHKEEVEKRKSNTSNKVKKASSNTKMNLLIEDDNNNENDEYISLNDITNEDMLDKAIAQMFKNLLPNEYEIKETHEYTQALPARYYEPGSHALNRQVAFALKHTDERLFLSWTKLRSKASDFEYNVIPDLYAQWKKFKRTNQNGTKVTRKSIMYWVRKENFEEYEKIKNTTIEHYLEKAFETGTEYDLAMVLKQMYKDKYVCVSYDKRGIWYQFRNHRWVSDKGLSLRSKISEEMFCLMSSKHSNLEKELQEYQEDDARKTFIAKKMKLIAEISIKLKRTSDKDHIMREAAEIFYDNEFVRNMDTNKYLMCFNNGVVDFANKVFRDGLPEDYITKSTKINYIPFEIATTDDEYIKAKKEIEDFMTKLFPIPDLKRYMQDHLAACLIGANKNQTFNVYHGSGSNGKSIIADLMSVTLGEYKGTVPITLVTDARGKIGGTSDEVLKLKGVRYAVMQEPSKGVKLNEGIMKELTGGDPIQARGLYSESEIFEPQFSLVVCTNSLFDIESNDDGTWRRIRKCDFLSKFIDEGETHTDDTPYVYLKDKSLKDKLPLFAPYFASILVKRAFETEGIIEDCESVLNASNKYRKGQDHIAAFISEKIMKTGDNKDKIKKTELTTEFKIWYELSQGSRKGPKGDEMYAYMNKKFGEVKSTGWHGVKIRYPDNEEDDDVMVDVK